MARVRIMAGSDVLAQFLTDRLSKSPLIETCQLVRDLDGLTCDQLAEQAIDTVVYHPRWQHRHGMVPDLTEADRVLSVCGQSDIKQVVLIGSAAIYAPSPNHPGIVTESQLSPRRGKNPIADQWRQLEALAADMQRQQPGIQLAILRPATVLLPDSPDYFSQLFQSRRTMTLPLYDPSLQLLSPDDLATAVCLAVERQASGPFNVAPAGIIPLRAALRLAHVQHVPVAAPLQPWVQRLRSLRGSAHSGEQLDYIRYSWTIANTKSHEILGFLPVHTSAEALIAFSQRDRPTPNAGGIPTAPTFDDFGLDPDYIQAWSKRLYKFLHDRYWRVEIKGIDHIPRQGRAVLVGVHRGFMPYDGVMAVHQVAQHRGRHIRFLTHPSLIKTPFPFNFQKLGGVKASRKNADHILQRDGLLGFFPEGIQGAFTAYREAYRLGQFSRNEFVKSALRNRAPILPFVTVGSAEIFPIMAKINWPWWQRISLWPCFPIAPPFPLLPLPLPSKWHTLFLPPMHIERDYPPEAADDPEVVRAIAQDVRQAMQNAMDQMRQRRKSIFTGSIFTGDDDA